MIDIQSYLRSLPALQQPDWAADPRLADVRADLVRMPALVDSEAVRRLRALLTEAAAGHIQVIQAGDCAEDPAEATPNDVVRKAGLIDMLAGTLQQDTRQPGAAGRSDGRAARQATHPRHRARRRSGASGVPGPLVNGPEPDPSGAAPTRRA